MNKIEEIKEVAQNWWVVLLQGILFICLGLIFAFNPVTSILWMVQILALYWIFSGILSIAGSIMNETEGSRLWTFIGGLVGIFAGAVLVIAPLIAAAVTATFWMYLMGFSSILYGITLMIGRVVAQDGSGVEVSRGASFLLGIINLVFGVLLIFYPLTAAAAFTVFAGVFGIIGGIALIVLAFRLKGINGLQEHKQESVA